MRFHGGDAVAQLKRAGRHGDSLQPASRFHGGKHVAQDPERTVYSPCSHARVRGVVLGDVTSESQ